MTRVWLSQILAVVRLEIKKTFFAKRGLWIYLLAAMPLVLFVAHSISVSYHIQSRAHLASRNEKPLTYQSLTSVRQGMTRAEVIEVLGKPPQSYSWDKEKQQEDGSSQMVVHESFTYSDGSNVLDRRSVTHAGVVYPSSARLCNVISYLLATRRTPVCHVCSCLSRWHG